MCSGWLQTITNLTSPTHKKTATHIIKHNIEPCHDIKVIRRPTIHCLRIVAMKRRERAVHWNRVYGIILMSFVICAEKRIARSKSWKWNWSCQSCKVETLSKRWGRIFNGMGRMQTWPTRCRIEWRHICFLISGWDFQPTWTACLHLSRGRWRAAFHHLQTTETYGSRWYAQLFRINTWRYNAT